MPPRKRLAAATGGPQTAEDAAQARRMAPAVERTLAALTLTPADDAAVALARSLAAAIDADERAGMTLSDLASKLLATLTALGATPQARARVKEGGVPSGPTRVDILRARRTS